MCDFCFCFVLFCFASLLLFLGVFLPVIYRRGVRYSRCPSLWLFTSFLVRFDCYTPFPPPSFSFRCPCPCFVFLSRLSCTIYICIWLPFLPYAYYMWSPWFVFVFVPWFFPLLNPSLAKMSSAGYFHPRFLLSAFFSVPTVFAPNLFWCNFLYLVTTPGFVADQLII